MSRCLQVRQGTENVLHCTYPERHRGACEFRTARWLLVREIARYAVMFLIASVFLLAGSIPN